MAQASGSTTASDNELRSALKKLGFMPGPITDSTRGLYLEKLKQLKTSTAPGRNSSATKTPLSQSITPPAAAARRKVSTPTSRDPGSSTCKLTPSFPSPPLPLPHSNSSLVITQLLHSLNNSSHLASDTAFLFPDGDVFLASRAVLSTQCSEMTPLLYSREDPFVINVGTLTGHTSRFYVRPSDLVVDLKQKISLSEGVSIPEQQLLLDQNELWNETVIGQTGIQDGSLLHLMLVTPPLDLSQQTSYFTSCVNPSLSITHFKLGLNLEQLVGVASPRLRPLRQPLPPHIYHIVHMYDVPYHAWVELMYYLYSTQLTQEKIGLSICVCCHVLAQHFNITSLSHKMLANIEQELTVNSAIKLLHFANSIHAPLLSEVAKTYLKAEE